MSSQYKVCSLFWEHSGNCYRLKNQGRLEDLLSDGWEISRVDTMSQTNFPSGAFGATNVYVLKKQSEEKQSEEKQSEDTNVRGSKPMNNDQWHAVWRESVEKYGKEIQSIVCMEECSELIQAVSKRLRGKPGATDNLAEEMADVTICLDLLKEMYGIPDAQLEEWIARKTARQSKRMQADDPFLKGEDAK